MLLWLGCKLKQRHWLRTAENRFQCKKEVRTLQFLIKAGKQFNWSVKQLELA